jgi:hypothetical protein
MVLSRKDRTAEVVQTLKTEGIDAEVFRPIAGASSLVFE